MQVHEVVLKQALRHLDIFQSSLHGQGLYVGILLGKVIHLGETLDASHLANILRQLLMELESGSKS